jgi:zinc protease
MRSIAVIAAVILLLAGILFALLRMSEDEKAPRTAHETVSDDIESFSLRNGMEVVLVHNDRVPAVSHTLWIRAGAADDPMGKSGIAHYLEHLMFKGTKRWSEGQFEKQINERGGALNAFTGADFTGYYVNIAKEHLETVMQLESDRFQRLLPPDNAFARELQVILEERRSRIENSPSALLAEQMRASLFRHHPYRIPIIGWMHEMEGLTAEDAKSFYDRYYHPGMMVLVVAGDITREQLQPLAERYYGSILPRQSSARNWLKEPPQTTARRVSLSHPLVQQERFSRYYVAPSYVEGETKHALPLEILNYWLGGGRTSLLYRKLVIEQQLATSVSSYYSGLTRGPAVFSISATPAEGVNLEQLEAAIDKVIIDAKDGRITEAGLKRAKTLLKAEAIYARDGLQNVAQIMGYLRMLDMDLSYYTEWDKHVEQVTAEQVRAAAQDVLRPEQSVTGTLIPSADAPITAGAKRPPEGDINGQQILH